MGIVLQPLFLFFYHIWGDIIYETINEVFNSVLSVF